MLQELKQPQQIDIPAPGDILSSEMRQLHGQSIWLADERLYANSKIGLPTHDREGAFSVVGEFALPGEKNDDARVAVVRKQHFDGQVSYALQGLEADGIRGIKKSDMPMVPIPTNGEALVVGRSGNVRADMLWSESAGFSGLVSREHVSISDKGMAVLLTDTSTNGTKIFEKETPNYNDAVYIGENGDNVEYLYTARAEEVARIRNEIAKRMGGMVRETIGRDTRLAEGVYEGSYGGEAIVVNYMKQPERIDKSVDAIIRSSTDASGKFRKDFVLQNVFDHVSKTMAYDSGAVESIFNRVGRKDGQKVSLDVYIKAGKGVCRHQALYAGIILERLIDKGLLNGKVSVDRNMIKGRDADKYDGHAWTRYTNSRGDVFILDVAQGRLDSLNNLVKENMRNSRAVWDYRRPEDRG